jgi:FkbM family methyltransferase
MVHPTAATRGQGLFFLERSRGIVGLSSKTAMHPLLSTMRMFARHPLAGRDKIAALARYARWQVASRVMRAGFVVPFADGARLLVERSLTGATGNIYFGLHEFEDMAFTCHLLRPGDLFVDIGANVGTYVVLGAAVAGARTIAYEPVEATLRYLRDNVGLNHVGDSVSIRTVALGAEPGRIRFTNDAGPMNHVALSGNASTVDVDVVRLDDDLERQVPLLIKLDVEGYEAAVLRGATKTLAAPGLKAVIVENNGQGSRYGFSTDEVATSLTHLGFERVTYEPFSRELSIVPDGRASKGNNELYVRDSAFVRNRVESARKVAVAGFAV